MTDVLGAYWRHRAIFNPDVLRIEAPRPPYDHVLELAARATHTHPGCLLQMVATERVVQVKTDNITLRQAEVFAHFSRSWRNCGESAPEPNVTVHTLTCARAAQHKRTDMSMLVCGSGDGTKLHRHAATSLLTIQRKKCTEPGLPISESIITEPSTSVSYPYGTRSETPACQRKAAESGVRERAVLPGVQHNRNM